MLNGSNKFITVVDVTKSNLTVFLRAKSNWESFYIVYCLGCRRLLSWTFLFFFAKQDQKEWKEHARSLKLGTTILANTVISTKVHAPTRNAMKIMCIDVSDNVRPVNAATWLPSKKEWKMRKKMGRKIYHKNFTEMSIL